MLAKCRLLALVLIGIGFASAACSLITDVDRSKIGSGGGVSDTGGASAVDDSGEGTGGQSAAGGTTNHDAGAKLDASNSNDDASSE